MCDFGPLSSIAPNAISLENSTLPDMDELLDKLENETFQQVSVVFPPPLLETVCSVMTNQSVDIERASTSNSTKTLSTEHQQSKQTEGNECSTCLNHAETEHQISSEQQIMTQICAAEKYQEAFKHGKETNTMKDEDIFEQIDRMAAQINAEESGREIEGTKDDKFANQPPLEKGSSEGIRHCSSNGNSFENFVAKMVTSILEQVLSEATDEVKTHGQNLNEIKEEEKMAVLEKGEQMSGGEGGGGDGATDEAEAVVTEAQQVPGVSSCSQLPFSSSQSVPSSTKNRGSDSLAIVHDLSVALDEFKLTESELQLGKKKPYWIPDEECLDCMLCATRFSIVNRRHHCRACGRVEFYAVLCRICCSKRRLLAYMEEKEGKQRVCVPCNRTLDRIEEYEQRMHSSNPCNTCGGDGNGNAITQNCAVSDATHQRTEQKNDATDLPQCQSSDSTRSNGASRPKKKSLLKQPASAGGPPVDHQTEVATASNSAQTSEEARPMSVSMNAMSGTNKRSVTFRDGVNPGHDGSTPQSAAQISTNSLSGQSVVVPPSPYQWLISGGSGRSSSSGSVAKKSSTHTTGNGTDPSSNDSKKLPRKMSKRSKERRMEEEAQSLLILKNDEHHTQNECRIWLVERRGNGAEEMLRRELAEIGSELRNSAENGGEWTIALRRNFHLRIESRKIRAEDPFHTLSVATRGLASLGVDELFLAFQYEPESLTDNAELMALLQQFDLIFQQCLDPQDDSPLDHQIGIRKCVYRMARLYPLFRKGQPLFGHKAASILFHRPHPNQNFANFHPPSRPFLTGVFVQMEELSWAMCVPCRLLLRLGMFSEEYPFPVVNVRRERPLFTASAVQNSVLKVLNDFRHWSYRMARLSGCSVTIRDSSTDVFLSTWALDEVRQIVTSNRNMVGWALDELNTVVDVDGDGVDAHLVCVQEEADDGMPSSFLTRIFSAGDNSFDSTEITIKKVVGASFVIFDGALRGNEQLLVSLVEDGLVVRLNSDLMEELVKSLMAGDSFSVTNEQGHCLSVTFRTLINEQSVIENGSHKSLSSSLQRLAPGALRSPIDGQHLDGHVQYGLDRSRLLRSLNFFQFSSEWALRLSAVINMLPGKFPSALQPRFFDLCEQLVNQIVPTLEPFLQELIAADQRSISLRIHVDGETICYETEKWQTMPEQHFVWTVTLDEQLIPFLYALCAWLPSLFFVELHTFIVSTRPLPALTVPDSPGDL